jgi:hypothetical protein
MVHEIGHLLLGPGHTVAGVMRAKWKFQDFDQVRKQWLTFDAGQRIRVQATLAASPSIIP